MSNAIELNLTNTSESTNTPSKLVVCLDQKRNPALALIDIHDTLSDDLIDLIHHGTTRCDEFERMYLDKYPLILSEYLVAVTDIIERKEMGMDHEHLIQVHDDCSDRIMELIK